jgi:hypothetical protein
MLLPDSIAWEINGANDLSEYRVFDFDGTLSCTSETCHLEGQVICRGEGRLVIVGPDKEFDLHSGKNQIKLDWPADTKNPKPRK